MSGTVAMRKWRFQLRLPLIVSRLEHRPGVARYSGFSREAKNLDFYVTYSLPIKKKKFKAQYRPTLSGHTKHIYRPNPAWRLPVPSPRSKWGVELMLAHVVGKSVNAFSCYVTIIKR